jgi:hypothetical protein
MLGAGVSPLAESTQFIQSAIDRNSCIQSFTI